MGLNFPSYNPYHNNLAQALEVVHCVEESIRILEELLSTGLKNEKGEVKVKPGKGGSVVEAPRGVLYHSYVFDEEGYVKEASVLTPTAQNVANMEEDIRVILPTIS
ncbi:Ni/Fe hydrogenase subunit alpha, partial [Candidatus Bathyarchaeota archaeon]